MAEVYLDVFCPDGASYIIMEATEEQIKGFQELARRLNDPSTDDYAPGMYVITSKDKLDLFQREKFFPEEAEDG